MYWAQRRYAEGEPLLLRHLEMEEKSLGPDNPALLFLFHEMEQFYRIQGRDSEAESFTQRALAVAAKAEEAKPAAPDDGRTAMGLVNSAYLHMKQGEYKRAEELYRRALEIDQKAGRPEYPSIAMDLSSLANAYCAQGLYDKAEALYKRSTQITEKALGADHPDVARRLIPLARCYGRAGKYAEAEAVLKRAIQMLDKPGPQVHLSLITVLGHYSRLLHALDREAEAKQIEARIEEIREKLTQANPNP
jgi:tetratricopeptide (TPR) repeat protein